MDIIALVGVFGSGFATGIIGLYFYLKSTGIIAGGKIDYEKLEAEIVSRLGNVSIEEAAAIFKRAQTLGLDGYSTDDAAELGVMAIKAMKPENVQ